MKLETLDWLANKTGVARIIYRGKNFYQHKFEYCYGNLLVSNKEIVRVFNNDGMVATPSLDFLEDFFKPFPVVNFCSKENGSISHVVISPENAIFQVGKRIFSKINLYLGVHSGWSNAFDKETLSIYKMGAVSARFILYNENEKLSSNYETLKNLTIDLQNILVEHDEISPEIYRNVMFDLREEIRILNFLETLYE